MSLITNFKKGDRIVRTEKSSDNDGSYRGEEMIFLGILNNRIYVLFTKKTIYSKPNHDFYYPEWKDGWKYYNNPSYLIDDDFLDAIDISILEKYLRRKKLKKLKNK